MRNWLIVAALAALSACTMGPDYVRPETDAPAQFGRLADGIGEVLPVAEFWQRFDDPLLTRLVEGALAENYDLRGALARVERARALARETGFDRLPTVTADAGYTESRGSAAQTPGISREQLDTEYYSAGTSAFWELDLFGRVRRGLEASRAEADAAEADLRAMQVSVAAEVARTYFELRGLQERLRIAQRNAENQRNTLALTQTRLEAGRGTEFDTARARSQLESTLSRIPSLEAAIAEAAHRLAILNGLDPTALLDELDESGDLPELPVEVAVGTPAELLRRRPDVQAAERRLAAATARVGVATADLFPRISLGGTFGSAAEDLGDLFSRDAEAYAFGPNLDWAFLDLGRVRARIAASDAQTKANLAAYEGTVLRALEEAESSLVRYNRVQVERDHLRYSTEASALAARLARMRFEAGAVDFLQVLDAERSLLAAEDQLADSRTRMATALVGVYRAVAGGWPARVPGEPVATRLESRED